MGQVFGFNGAKEPAYALLWRSSAFEVRHYPPYFVAQVSLASDAANNTAFRQLADYIGVFGTPKNSKSQAISMTAPVVTKPEAIAMTAPVVSNGQFMQFVLPEEFKSMDEIPKPANPDIQIQQISGRFVAVTRFNGAYSYQYFMQHYQELFAKMQEEGFLSSKAVSDSQGAAEDEEKQAVTWSFAQYNPPFAIPYFRRNEVWIEMLPEYTTEKFQELTAKAKEGGDAAQK